MYNDNDNDGVVEDAISNFVASLIRTWVPIVVGGVLAWLSVRLDIVVDDGTEQGMIIALTGLLTAIYYGIVRLIEVKASPAIGWLLGLAKKPGYAVTEPPAESPGANKDL